MRRLKLRADGMIAARVSRLMRPHADLELAEQRGRAADYGVARLDRADALRRAGIDQIPGRERVERRGEFDQPPAAIDQLIGVALLPGFAIDLKADWQCVGVCHLVGRYHPWPRHRIAV